MDEVADLLLRVVEHGEPEDVTDQQHHIWVRGNICPWDPGDYVSHSISTDFSNSRTIHLKFDSAVSVMTGTLYLQNVHGNLEEVGRMCAGCDGTTTLLDGTIQHTFNELWPETYQLHVTANNLVPAWFDVSFLDE